MENIFIILAIIASVIYRFYTNYKEEMEKAAKRKQPNRRVQLPRDHEGDHLPDPVRRATPPQPAPRQPEFPRRQPIPIPEIRKPRARKAISPDEAVRAQPVIPQERTQAHRIKTKREELKRIELIVDDEEGHTHAISPQEVRFDLRTAIIQSAILERPYK